MIKFHNESRFFRTFDAQLCSFNSATSKLHIWKAKINEYGTEYLNDEPHSSHESQ